MNTTTARHSVEVVPDAASLATRAAEWLIGQINHAITRRGRAVIALSGGSTPRALFACLAQSPWRERVRWDAVHVFWGDERFVAEDDEASNVRVARATLLDRVGIVEAHVYAPPFDPAPSDDVEATLTRARAAASTYETTLHAFYGDRRLDPARPFFDVNLLGLGEDGHTASLFPGSSALDEHDHWVVAVRSDDKPPPVRITLTYPALESTHAVLFLASGSGKRDIARHVLAGDDSLPAARVHPLGGTLWILDQAAAG